MNVEDLRSGMRAMSKPILYLMSKYSGCEAESLKENQDAWLALNAKGYWAYSPICESHNIEEYRQELEQESPNNLLAKPIDYVARDLRLLEVWLKDDANQFLHKGCGGVVHDIGGDQGMCFKCQDYCDLETTDLYNRYDSGVVGVVLPSAILMIIDTGFERKIIWDSKGAQKEYEFMKAHHILVISLETALTVPPAQWEDYVL